ncbi:MAG TPA: hypothetical protein VLI69_03860 [Gammaproteobacteria bacterium]|nr:hypothetical protein [Gammaproteobacteria bacterium]
MDKIEMATKPVLNKTSTSGVHTKGKAVHKSFAKTDSAKTRKVRTPPKLGKFSRSAIKSAVRAVSSKKK